MVKTAEILRTEREKLFDRFADKFKTAYYLNRKVVSFQANKDEPIYRWFKYKEGFSSALVKYFLSKYAPKPGMLLDPFAGAGTTLFAGQELGWESFGIELLPVGVFVMQIRQALDNIDVDRLRDVSANLWTELSKSKEYNKYINHLSITKDAFSVETEEYLNKYLTYTCKIKDKYIQAILKFAAFTVLEEISFTRKDGQYLRWDYRSNRILSGKPFNKGKILTFEEALNSKLNQIIQDFSYKQTTSLFEPFDNIETEKKPVKIIEGSCLEQLPQLKSNFFDFIVTSPPYCNRYDYTRTYALELVYLGYDNDKVRNLRQTMLSCTVENKEKIEYLEQFYTSINQVEVFKNVIDIYNNSNAMTEVNSVLDELNECDKLNNNNIPRMVKNYFLELCFVIYEMSRVSKSGGYCVMVNDNVRYGGEEIPVDLILSEFAENFGFNINNIFVLPKGKGNSSQQMGNYGRTEVRKCVYLWQKK
ncbi:MAG: site-specific DNA-methyltransferase [Enterococcus sp.]|nr:site-specific DNA-methyltransferase [Enterococcus sp.]